MEASKNMDVKKDQLYENRVIRMSSALRNSLGLNINDIVTLRDKNSKIVVLRVEEILNEDLIYFPNVATITTRNAELINVNVGIERVSSITLGCDPEMFIIDKRSAQIIPASRYFRHMGEIGYDGLLMEIRPRPSLTPEGLTANIGDLFKKARMLIDSFGEGNRVKFVAASSYGGLPAGFHLHFGLPRNIMGFDPVVVNLARLMTIAFDYYIGVPSIIPEGNIDYKRRTKPHVAYGKPGNYRLDDRTFEYRLPGGILLRHPVYTCGIIAIGATVVEDLVSRIKEYTDDFSSLRLINTHTDLKRIYPNIQDIKGLFGLICSISIEPAMRCLENIINDIRQMIGYNQRAEPIENFFKCILNGTIFENDIEKNWGGINAVQQRQMGIL